MNGDQCIIITKTIDRPGTGHPRGMKVEGEGRKTNRNCDNYPDTEVTTLHNFHCPAILGELLKIGVPFTRSNLNEDSIEQIASAVIIAHGTI